jgi:ribulose-phosphate 3-epimerase
MSGHRIRLSVGILTADLTRLGAELSILKGRADYVHVDVMDGAFCPQLTVGPVFLRAAARAGIPVDAHLMVEEPRRFLPEVIAAGARQVTVHAESTKHLHRTLQELTELSGPDRRVLRGLALNPATPIDTVEPVLDMVDLVLVLAVNPGWSGQAPAQNTARRVEALRSLAARSGRDGLLVGVDGGVTRSNLAEVVSWQPDLIVSGSAIFDGANAATNLTETLNTLAGTAAPTRSTPIGARP